MKLKFPYKCVCRRLNCRMSVVTSREARVVVIKSNVSACGIEYYTLSLHDALPKIGRASCRARV